MNHGRMGPPNYEESSIYRIALLSNSFAFDHFKKSAEDNPEIQEERVILQVVFVEFHLLGNSEFVAPIDLRPAGQAGSQHMNSPLSAEFDQVVLVEEGGTRTDNAHVALQNADQLGKFVNAGFAEESADHGPVPVRIFEEVGRHGGRISPHGAEFGHPENRVEPADAVGPVERRSS